MHITIILYHTGLMNMVRKCNSRTLVESNVERKVRTVFTAQLIGLNEQFIILHIITYLLLSYSNSISLLLNF